MNPPVYTRVVRNEMRPVPCVCVAGPCGWRHYERTGRRIETIRRAGEPPVVRVLEEVC